MANTGLEFSWKLWPPSDETRALVTERIASNLLRFPWSQQRHSLLSEAEAAEKAKRVEELAFEATQRHADQAADDPNGGQPLKGSSLVGLYAKEASRAALGFLKHGGKGFSTADEKNPTVEVSYHNHTAGDRDEAFSDSKEGFTIVEGSKEVAVADFTVSSKFGGKVLDISDENTPIGEGFDQISASAVASENTSDVKDIAVCVEAAKELALTDEKDSVQQGIAEPEVLESVDVGREGWVFDISTGDRQMLDRVAARELFQPLQDRIGSVSKICLSNKSFGVDAAEVAAEFIMPVKNSLLDVDLSDIVAGRPEEEALNAMNIFSAALEGVNLQALNLSDNALGEKGVRAFSRLLQSQRSLQKLYFMNNGISEQAARAIHELLPSGKDLITLHFHNNMTGDEGAIALSPLIEAATFLEDFRLSSSRLAEAGAVAVTKALRSGRNLRKLDLRDNMFGPKGGIKLGRTLRQHQWLIEAHLSDLGLEDSGARSILEALKENAPCLEILDLGGNEITSATAGHIASCIKEKHNLKKLGLAENELKDKGCKIISEALIEGHDNLRELDLSVNYVRNSGALALGEAVRNKKGFKVLNVNGNFISMSGLDDLRKLLKKGFCGEAVLGPLDENEEEDSENNEDVQSSDEHEDEEPDEDEDSEESEGKPEDNKDLDLSFGSLAVVD